MYESNVHRRDHQREMLLATIFDRINGDPGEYPDRIIVESGFDLGMDGQDILSASNWISSRGHLIVIGPAAKFVLTRHAADDIEDWLRDNPSILREAQELIAMNKQKESVAETESDVTEGAPQMFISHASKDVHLARELINCLNNCLALPDNAIRCTSVPGYGLDVGDDVERQLRRNIKDAKVVIGLCTPNSMQSGYMIMELGAAWVLEKRTCALLTPTMSFDALPGPIGGKHAIKLSSAPDVTGLMSTLSREIGASMRPAARVTAAVLALAEAAQKYKP